MPEPYPKIKSICRGSELQYTRTPRCGWKVSVLKTNQHRKISGRSHARHAERKIMGEQKTKVKNSPCDLLAFGRAGQQDAALHFTFREPILDMAWQLSTPLTPAECR